MTVVGITGADGFLGWHVRCRLHADDIRTVPANRDTFADTDRLDTFVDSCDLILHAAGVNRDNETDDVATGNSSLARQLVDAMRRTGHWCPVVYANSTQSEHDTEYGAAKRDAATTLAGELGAHDAAFVDLVLPHLFGEFGRPFYNSAVTTFAHLLAVGGEPDINADGRLELLHAQDVATRVAELACSLDTIESGRHRLTGEQIGIPAAWDLLAAQHRRYVAEWTVPAFANRFELRMFNMLRSQLYLAGFYPRPITAHTDPRGSFSELCRADGTGQASISTSMPGVTRGDHFHFDKIERFVVVSGEATIRLRRLFTDDVREYPVSGAAPVLIDMPPLVTHNVTNTGDDTVITFFWAGDHFDPSVPDTVAEPVVRSEP